QGRALPGAQGDGDRAGPAGRDRRGAGLAGDADRLEGAGHERRAGRHRLPGGRRAPDPASERLRRHDPARAGDRPGPGRDRAQGGAGRREEGEAGERRLDLGRPARRGDRARDGPGHDRDRARSAHHGPGDPHDDAGDDPGSADHARHDDPLTRVAVLSGGRSSEHEVSLASAGSVAAGLRGRGHEVVSVELPREGPWLPDAATAATLAGADVVFPVLHGPFGEDGSVQGLLELAGVPYVGAGVTASALCMDKDLLKSVLRDQGVPVTANVTLRRGEEARNPFDYPVFVKPARLGSSVGISKAHDERELRDAVALAFAHDEKVLVEQLVSGIEVEVGVLGNESPSVSLPGEIVVSKGEWY